MLSQKLFSMAVPVADGRILSFKAKVPQKTPPEKLFADLLKRLARKVVCDVTECPPDAMSAHLARLDDLRDVFGHMLRHDYRETPEANPSGAQLLHPSTLHDWLAVLELTRKQHRAPAFVNSSDDQFASIDRKLCVIAGLLASNAQAVDLFTGPESEVEP